MPHLLLTIGFIVRSRLLSTCCLWLRIGDAASNTFIDYDLPGGGVFYYSITALDVSGNESVSSDPVSVMLVGIEDRIELASTSYELHQNFPNPFNGITTITYALPATSKTALKIYDLQGRLVTTLVDEVQQAGCHERTWGKGMATGLYMYAFEAQAVADGRTIHRSVRKLLLLK